MRKQHIQVEFRASGVRIVPVEHLGCGFVDFAERLHLCARHVRRDERHRVRALSCQPLQVVLWRGGGMHGVSERSDFVAGQPAAVELRVSDGVQRQQWHCMCCLSHWHLQTVQRSGLVSALSGQFVGAR